IDPRGGSRLARWPARTRANPPRAPRFPAAARRAIPSRRRGGSSTVGARALQSVARAPCVRASARGPALGAMTRAGQHDPPVGLPLPLDVVYVNYDSTALLHASIASLLALPADGFVLQRVV